MSGSAIWPRRLRMRLVGALAMLFSLTRNSHCSDRTTPILSLNGSVVRRWPTQEFTGFSIGAAAATAYNRTSDSNLPHNRRMANVPSHAGPGCIAPLLDGGKSGRRDLHHQGQP